VPKHAGITFFVFPMDQPGVEVRPIVQITGDARFNEVFFTDAFVPDANRLGEVNGVWKTLLTALGFERSVMGVRGVGSRAVDPRFIGTADDLIGLARRHGKLGDAATVAVLADVYAARTAARLNTVRYAAEGRAGDPSSMSVGKLAMSAILHGTARVRRDIIGAASLLDERTEPPGEAELANFFTLDAYFTSIGGGTDQIQRNIISERILGLPKEEDPSKSVPFNEVRR
jgi:alkylation response protein AidB-like acyl-CoA dehydrogenase